MALTDTIFYKNFTAKSRLLRVEYMPPSHLDISVTPDYIEFPDNVIFNKDFKINNSYDKDIPVGFQLASEMEITLNMESLTGATGGGFTWEEVRSAILTVQTDTPRTIVLNLGIPVNIYSVGIWRILEDTNGDSTYDKIVFEGGQQIEPSWEIDFELSADVTTKQTTVLKLLDVYRLSMQALTVTDLGQAAVPDFVGTGYQQFIYGSTVGGSPYRPQHKMFVTESITGGATGQFARFQSFDTFNAEYQQYIGSALSVYRRESTAFTFVNSVTDHWTFYEPNTNSLTYESTKSATTVPDSNLYFIASWKGGLVSNIEPITGMYHPGEGFASGNNMQDVLKILCENYYCKSYIDFDNFSIEFVKVLDATKGDALTITRDEYREKLKFKNGTNRVAKYVAYIKGLYDDDIDEFNTEATNVRNSRYQDINLILHNHPANGYTYYDGRDPDFLFGLTEEALASSMMAKLTVGGIDEYIRISEACTLDLGAGQTFSEELGYDTEDYPEYIIGTDDFDTFSAKLLAWSAQRVALASMGLSISKAGNFLFGNKNQGTITSVFDSSFINIEHLGDTVTLDIDDLIGTTGQFSSKGIITSVDENLLEGTSTVTIFIRGQ
jgi:hypothetical protein